MTIWGSSIDYTSRGNTQVIIDILQTTTPGIKVATYTERANILEGVHGCVDVIKKLRCTVASTRVSGG